MLYFLFVIHLMRNSLFALFMLSGRVTLLFLVYIPPFVPVFLSIYCFGGLQCFISCLPVTIVSMSVDAV